MLPVDPPMSPLSLRREREPPSAGSPEDRAILRRKPDDPQALCRFARLLLAENPDSILARLILSGYAETEVETEILLRDAVRIGMRVWRAELSGEADVAWFDDPSTRTFMQAIRSYGQTLVLRGMQVEAERCADFLLVLDPQDRLMARELVRLSRRGADGAATLKR
jgi:hypothetical protein